MKFWSVFWRLLLLALAFSVVFTVLINAAYGGVLNDQAVLWKPTIGWWLISAAVWIVSSTSPTGFCAMLFGRKFGLPSEAWLLIGRYTACLFAALGLVNALFVELARFAPQAWVTFKLLAVPVGLLLLSFILPRKLARVSIERANPLLNADARQETPRAG